MKLIKKRPIRFYKEVSGKEPVLEWIKELSKEDRKIIGEDIKTAQGQFPFEMPVVKFLCKGLWEIRSDLNNRISRIIFILNNGEMVLLHGFIKKSQKTSPSDLSLAEKRTKKYKNNFK